MSKARDRLSELARMPDYSTCDCLQCAAGRFHQTPTVRMAFHSVLGEEQAERSLNKMGPAWTLVLALCYKHKAGSAMDALITIAEGDIDLTTNGARPQ